MCVSDWSSRWWWLQPSGRRSSDQIRTEWTRRWWHSYCGNLVSLMTLFVLPSPGSVPPRPPGVYEGLHPSHSDGGESLRAGRWPDEDEGGGVSHQWTPRQRKKHKRTFRDRKLLLWIHKIHLMMKLMMMMTTMVLFRFCIRRWRGWRRICLEFKRYSPPTLGC